MNIFLIVIILLLSAVSFYFAYVRRTEYSSQSKIWFKLSAFFLVVLFYFQIRTASSPTELSAFLPPYPNIAEVLYVPNPKDVRFIAEGPFSPPELRRELNVAVAEYERQYSGKQWFFKTSDQPEQVLNFYRNEKNRKGWAVTEHSEHHLVLENSQYLLSIFFIRDQEKLTTIMYSLEDHKVKK